MSTTIRDEKGKFSHILGESFHDGSQFVINTTPEEETISFRHKSGSSITFTADGDISIVAKRNFHLLAGAKQEGTQHSIRFGGGPLHFEQEKKFDMIVEDVMDLQVTKAFRSEMLTATMTVEESWVNKCEAWTLDVTNRVYTKCNAFDTETDSHSDTVAGIYLIESATGVGIKNTNPKGGIHIETLGFMTVKSTQAYNTEVLLGDMNTNVSVGMYSVQVAANQIDMDALKIYLN